MLPILQMKNRKIPLIIYTIVNLITIMGLIIKNRFLNFTARIINGFTNVRGENFKKIKEKFHKFHNLFFKDFYFKYFHKFLIIF